MHMDKYAALRPFAYHLTHRSNVEGLRKTGCLFPTAYLMKRADKLDLVRLRRSKAIQLAIADMSMSISIRDQAPLHRGNALFPDGYTFGEFVESLNQRIFFWPGTEAEPISYGIRHFERYRDEHPALIRIRLASLLAVNPGIMPRFCRFNSGSPRCSAGKKSPRGPHTFLSLEEFNCTPSEVVEITFEDPVVLPKDSQLGTRPQGPWRQLFH